MIGIEYKVSCNEVERYMQKWFSLENYVYQEKALDKLFFSLCKYNKNIEDILIKCSALNDFYSTNIMDVHSVTKHYTTIDIDYRLDLNDENLVDDLSHVMMKNGRTMHFYSFATKYCSHHKPMEYPIYDKYVGDVLKFFRKRDKFIAFKNEDLLVYSRFKSIVANFRTFYGLEAYNFKQIDRYLWQLRKEYYKRNY